MSTSSATAWVPTQPARQGGGSTGLLDGSQVGQSSQCYTIRQSSGSLRLANGVPCWISSPVRVLYVYKKDFSILRRRADSFQKQPLSSSTLPQFLLNTLEKLVTFGLMDASGVSIVKLLERMFFPIVRKCV